MYAKCSNDKIGWTYITAYCLDSFCISPLKSVVIKFSVKSTFWNT
jgi:hypothetical protein